MNNKEKYKEAFSSMHISNNFSLEADKMKNTNRKPNRLVAGLAVGVLLLGSTGVAYANDIGGIQRKIQVFLHGEKTDVTFEFDGNGNYQMDYIDAEGNNKHQGGGGVAFNADGSERPLTEEELMEEFSQPDVIYNEDGSVIVYWYGQEIDITDKFKDEICYLELVNGEEKLYMTVEYDNGYCTSPYKYIIPTE